MSAQRTEGVPPRFHHIGVDCGARCDDEVDAGIGQRVTCYWCRWTIERPKRDAARRRRERRRPPRAPFADLPGVCSMCGGLLSGRRTSWCSDGCVALWFIATTPRIAFDRLVEDLTDLCWICFAEPAAEVDHVRPLWSLTDQERTEIRWWLPSNLQLLGMRCHKAKSAAEAAERARLRRGQEALI